MDKCFQCLRIYMLLNSRLLEIERKKKCMVLFSAEGNVQRQLHIYQCQTRLQYYILNI